VEQEGGYDKLLKKLWMKWEWGIDPAAACYDGTMDSRDGIGLIALILLLLLLFLVF
jgi:hypothetical protein